MIYHKHNRSIDKVKLDEIRVLLKKAYNLELKIKDIHAVEKKILNIEDKCVGRFAGHIEDYILLYYSVYAHYSKARNKKLPVIEIGTLFGCSTILIWHAIKDAKATASIFAIDPLEGYYGVTSGEKGSIRPKDVITGLEIDEATVRGNLELFGISDEDCKLITEVSQNPKVIDGLRNVRASFLFVDGDHSRSGLFLDLSNYIKLLVPSSTIVIDNFVDPDWLGVTEEIFRGKYFETQLKPLAFEKRLLVCRNSKSTREHWVYGEICEGLLEIISNKEQSRNSLLRKIAESDKKFGNLLDKLQGIADLQKAISELKEKSASDPSGSSKRLETLAGTLSNLEKTLSSSQESLSQTAAEMHDKELSALGELRASLEDLVRGELGNSEKRILGLGKTLSGFEKVLSDLKNGITKTIGERYSEELRILRELHAEELSALGEMRASLEKSSSEESGRAAERFDGLSASVTALGKALKAFQDGAARTAGEQHAEELSALGEVKASLEASVSEQSGKAVERFDGLSASVTALGKALKAFQDGAARTAGEQHAEELSALGEVKASLEASSSEESGKASERFDALTSSLSDLRSDFGGITKQNADLNEQLRSTQLDLTTKEGVILKLTSDFERCRRLALQYENELSEAKQLNISAKHKEDALKNELIRLSSKLMITNRDKELIREVL